MSLQLADELQALPDGSVIPMVIEDYIRERDMLKECAP